MRRAALVAALVFALATMAIAPASAYRVKRGDTVASIAARHSTTIRRLVRLNPHRLHNVNRIFVGQHLRLAGKVKHVKHPKHPKPRKLHRVRNPYQRVNFRGVTLNRRTVQLVRCAERGMPSNFDFAQGSYNGGGVAASGGTHDGGGALDVWRPFTRHAVIRLRKCGFAAWRRYPYQGPWSQHIHAIAIGDKEASFSARAQMVSYKFGGDGLGGRDYEPRPPRLRLFSALASFTGGLSKPLAVPPDAAADGDVSALALARPPRTHAPWSLWWRKVAFCESSLRWHINTGNGFLGGLQFYLPTWLGYGGAQFAFFPNRASAKEQKTVAERVLRGQGIGAWPACGPKGLK